MKQTTRSLAPIIVGVGASAGGLEAFRELLRAISHVGEIAIVFLQHLEKDSDAGFAEFLADSTSLEVVVATGQTKVRPGSVYVCPPWTLPEIKNGSLRITKPDDRKRPATPIDHLFQSIADDQGERGVGVILSGMGSDGTLGLKAISDAGGMTFAQTAESAKYDSMPRSAATTGVADHVLAPKEVGLELSKHAAHLSGINDQLRLASSVDEIHNAIPAISKRLVEVTNHNFQHYKQNTLARRIRRRMQLLKLLSVNGYVNFLCDDDEEPQALFRELLISVTAFFRDPDAFEVLATKAMQKLFVNRKPEDTVRIWVPGCATGEEAFTLAILCREQMDRLATPPEVQIFATDIDERALKIGRQGTYPIGIADDVSEERLSRFFVKRGKRYQVTKDVRELVLFSTHNLISDPPFSRLDLISCRNLLIYLGSHLQQKLIPLFHYALRPSGYLMLGPSENISSHGELFRMIDAKNRISQRKSTGVDSTIALWPESGSATMSVCNQSTTTPPDSTKDLMQVMQRIVLDEFAPKSVIVDETGKVLCASADMHKYLTVGTGSFQNDVIKMARTGLRIGLRASLQEARAKRRRVDHDNLSVRIDGKLQRIMLTVQPMPRLGEGKELFMIVFHDSGLPLVRGDDKRVAHAEDAATALHVVSNADSIIDHLEQELSSTRDDLEKSIQEFETANEELKSSNEELLSLNEEMQSANEELQTSKEEIQSAVTALELANSDLENLLRSTQIATIFLDDNLRIRSFTPAATEIYGLITTDVGRPLSQLMPLAANIPPLPGTSSFDESEFPESMIQTLAGKWFVRRVLPYHSRRGARDGIVVTFTDVTELQEGRQRFASLVQASSQIVWVTNADGVVCEDSPSWRAFTGQSVEKWLGNGWLEAIHPDYREPTMAAWRNVISTGELFTIEYPLLHHSGEYKWNLVRAVAQRQFDGSIRSWVGMNIDIDERKRGEIELERLNRQSQLAMSAGRLGAFQWDIIDDQVTWSAQLYELFGRTPEQFGGTLASFVSIVYPDDRDAVAASIQGQLASNTAHHEVEFRVLRGDSGQVAWFNAIGVIQRDETGRPLGITGVCTDTTERKRATIVLAERESHLRRVIDNIVGFVGVLDTQGVLQEVNETALIAGGLTRDDVIGKPFWECYWWSHDETLVQNLKAAIITALRGELVRYDVDVRMAGDSRLTIDFMLAPVKDANGIVTHLIPSGVDISERKFAELEVQQRVSQLDLALESGRMGIWEWDLTEDYVRWSSQLYGMFGYSADSFQPTKDRFINAVHPDDRSQLQLLVQSASEGTSDNHEVEFRVVRGDNGEVVWMHCRGTVRCDRDGKAVSILSVSVDVTERKQGELTLAFLAELQSTLTGLASAEAIIATASQEVSRFLKLSHFVLSEMDGRAGYATIVADYCSDDSGCLTGVYEMSEFATDEERQLLAAGRPMVVNNTAAAIRTNRFIENFSALKIGAIINAPSSRDQQLRFMLTAAKRHPYVWREHEIDLMRQLANILRLKLDRANAEKALQESEAKFRDLADNISPFAWMTDATGSIFWYNQRWFDYTGTTLDEMRDWGWKSVQHPDHIDRVVNHWRECLASGEAWEDTFPLRSKDGEYQWFLSRAQPIRDETGDIVRWFGTNTDVTETRQAQEQLVESRERLSMSMASARMGSYEWALSSDIVFCDEQHRAITGLTADQSTGTDFLNLVHPEDAEANRSAIESTISGKSDYETEFRIVRPDGKVRWLAARGKIIQADGDCPLRFVGINWDITDAKEQEQRIRESEERLRNAAEAAGFGTVHVDLIHGTVTYSHELRRLLGLPANVDEPLLTNSIPEWVHPDDREACAAHYKELAQLAEGNTGRIDHRIVCSNGQIRWVRLQTKPVYTGKGVRRKATQLIGTVLDITLQREFEQSLQAARLEAEAANQSKSEFLANMSHEIRTPMTAILGYADLVADKAGDDEMLQYVRTIRRNGDFLLEIINDILDLSKIEAGKFEISQQRFSPQQLVEDVRSIMEVRAAGSKIELEVEYRGRIPVQIESDPKRLRQILINLVGNAVKFTLIGEVRIVVSYLANVNQMRFDVVDSGIGISDQQKNRLFQPFSQGDGNVNREFGGTGLGLVISKRLTEMLGGEISVESELGKGSTFTVTIAAGEAQNIAMFTPEPETSHVHAHPQVTDVKLACHVLVVDDRRDIRFLTKRFLTSAGATVTEAEDGEVAVGAVTTAMENQGPFDLILLDMQMPKLDGYTTAKILRKLGFTNPIVALTADAMQGDMNRCIESGCNDYLSKPIDKALLLNLVSKLTSRAEAHAK